VNSDGGAYSFNTTGVVTFNQSIAAANYAASNLLTAAATNAGEIDFTAASKKLDVEDNAVVDQDYSSDASPIWAGATIDSIVFGDVYDAQEEPTGFVDRTATLSWADGSHTLTITGNHDIYIYGVKTTKGTDSIQITDATDLYWIYYNAAGALTASTTHPGWALPIMATVYWNTDGGGGSYNKGLAGEERHGLVMDWAAHEYLHNTVGSRYESGLAGTFDDTTLSIATGEWHDEDIHHTLASPETTCNVLYKNGSAAWEWDAGASVYYKLNGTALRYNNGNALADCTSNQYMAMWIFATNDISVPIVALMGQRQDNKLKDARTNNTYESLSFGELPFWEMKILYRVILRSTGSPPTYVETLDLRAVSNLPAGTYIATAHATLTGLTTGNDHSQYLLADGTTALAGAWNMGSQVLTNVNIDSGNIDLAVTIDAIPSMYLDFYLSDTLEGVIATYYDMYDQPTGGVESTISDSFNAGDDQLLAVQITESGQPGIVELRAGVYKAHIHAAKTVGAASATLYWTLSTRTTGDSETVRMTSEVSGVIAGSNTEYELRATLATNITINNTDRLIWKLYANVTA
jgi:hypothetical protein